MIGKLLCKLFGHTHNGHLYDGSEYLGLDQWDNAPDGIGRVHVTVLGKCPRCKTRVRVGQFHRPRIVSDLWARVDRENAKLLPKWSQARSWPRSTLTANGDKAFKQAPRGKRRRPPPR